MKALFIASTNDMTPTAGPAEAPASMSVTITDPAGSTKGHANQPEWRITDNKLHLVLLPAEVALDAEGEEWTVAWTWEDTLAKTRTVYETYLVVAAGREPVYGEVVLTVGENTYVSLAEAGAYLVGADTTVWNSASWDERSRALREATLAIDSLSLDGAKYATAPTTQTLAFPRTRYPRLRRDPAYAPAPDEGVVPESVKMAQVAEAAERIRRQKDSRTKLQQAGVKSVSIEGVSESYELPPTREVWSAEAREWMAGWVNEAVGTR